MTEPIWVSRAEAERLHELVIEVAGGAAGLRDAGLLESALAKPQHQFGLVPLSYRPKYSVKPLSVRKPMGYLNRPEFTGECFVQMSGYFINVVQVCIECLLCFLWRDITNGAVQAFGVVPVHPFQGFPFDSADGFPWAEEVDDFCFEQASHSHAHWHRSRPHDSEETIPVKPHIAIQTVCKLGCINLRNVALFKPEKTLRQNPCDDLCAGYLREPQKHLGQRTRQSV